MHTDIVPNMGTLGGIYTGLTYATNPSVFCVACDMPLLQPDLLSYLTSILGEYDAVVPYVEGESSSAPTFQTLSAVYSKRCLPAITQMFAEGELRVHALYERLSVRKVSPLEWQPLDPLGLSFLNINTPADFEKAAQMMTSLT
jgi:molybdopterin-guanine dinucleotide biosynthesis protein A